MKLRTRLHKRGMTSLLMTSKACSGTGSIVLPGSLGMMESISTNKIRFASSCPLRVEIGMGASDFLDTLYRLLASVSSSARFRTEGIPQSSKSPAQRASPSYHKIRFTLKVKIFSLSPPNEDQTVSFQIGWAISPTPSRFRPPTRQVGCRLGSEKYSRAEKVIHA
jgi:hypothetical protein